MTSRTRRDPRLDARPRSDHLLPAMPEDEAPPAPKLSREGKSRAGKRFDRRAAALKENLRRRKGQVRGRDEPQAPPDTDS